MNRSEFDQFDDPTPASHELGDEEFLVDAPGKSSSGNRTALIITLVMATSLGIAGVVWWNNRPEPEPPVVETREQKRRETRAAFSHEVGNLRGTADAATRAEVEKVLREFSLAVKERNAARIGNLFSGRRLLQEAVALGAPPLKASEMNSVSRVVTAAVSKRIAENADEWDWNDIEIRFVRLQRGGSEALVYLRLNTEFGLAKARIWLIRERDRWKLFDTESLEIGLRMSRLFYAGMQAARARPGHEAVWQAQIQSCRGLIKSMQSRDADAMRLAIAGARLEKLPSQLRAMLPLTHAIVKESEQKWDEALKYCDETIALNPDLLVVYVVRARCLNLLERYDDAERSARRFLQELGDDAVAYAPLAVALNGRGQSKEAFAAVNKGFDDDPNSAECLAALAILLKGERKDEVGARFARMPRARDVFDDVALSLLNAGEFEALDAVLKVHRKLDPGSPLNGYYQAELHFNRADYAKSMAAAEPSLAKLQGNDRRQCLRVYLDSAFSIRKTMEGYRKVEKYDPRFTFTYLARGLLRESRFAELKELAAAHRKKFGHIPLQQRIDAEIAFHERKLGDAVKLFRQALKQEDGADQKDLIRNRIIDALTSDGKPLAAYAEFAPSQETFARIARRLRLKRHAGSLRQLIDRHRAEFPKDVWLHYHSARESFLREDFAEGLKILERAIPNVADEQTRDSFLNLFHTSAYQTGRWSSVMKSSPVPRESFRDFADRLLAHSRTGDLESLVADYGKSHPADPNLDYYRGLLAANANQLPNAERHLRAAWQRASDKSTKGRCRYALVRNMLRRGRGSEAYRTLTPRDAVFGQVAAHFDREKEPEKLAALLEEHRPHAGEDYWPKYYSIRLAILRTDYDVAIERLQPLLKTVEPPWRRSSLRQLYYECRVEQGNALRAYREAEDPQAAFGGLMAALGEEKHAVQRKELLERHHRAYPNDIAYFQQLARLSEQKKDWPGAVRHYRAALKLDNGESDWRIRGPLVDALYKAGRPFESYQQVTPVDQTFARLANLFFMDQKPAELRKLVALHGAKKPHDPAVALWRAEVAWLEKDYKSALAIIDARRDVLLEDSSTAWRARRRLIYACLKLGQVKRAERALYASHQSWPDTWHQALIAAVKKDLPGLRRRLLELLDDEYDASDFYDDEILGPALRDPAFAKLRRVIPPPDKKPVPQPD